jgi:hypothetical protein
MSEQAIAQKFSKVLLALGLAFFVALPAAAQVAVSQNGSANVSLPIAVPPGIAGMVPNLSLLYSGNNNVNGPVGYGWTVQGMSMISRCPSSKKLDGVTSAVNFDGNDKLCLDGQRLIPTDDKGTALGADPLRPGDSTGGSGTTAIREFRTERNIYARIRAYGAAGGLAANGPAYFKVWTKSGQIYEYGVNANATANAQITAQGKNVVVAWPVSRISDTIGNFIDFQYSQRDLASGSNVGGVATPGRDWRLDEIRYTGHGTQLPVNKVVFEYLDRPVAAGAQDRAEAFQNGSKNVSVNLLQAVRTYVNWPAGQTTMPATAVKVKAYMLSYIAGPSTGRSRLTSVAECLGANDKICKPATVMSYSPGGGAAYQANAVFRGSSMATLAMQDANLGTVGVLLGDFFGTGRTSILRWNTNGPSNQLYRSEGDGRFTAVTLSSTGSYNIVTEPLSTAGYNAKTGCFYSIVADFNGDGLSDILRVSNKTTPDNTSCGTQPPSLLFLSNGDGSFSSAAITTAGLDLTTLKSSVSQHYCAGGGGNPVVRPTGAQQSISAVADITTNCTPGAYVGTSQTPGSMFHVLDVNNDGLLDIVTTIIPGYPPTGATVTDESLCKTQTCTRVFLGQQGGGFVETATNLIHRSVYAAPPAPYQAWLQRPFVVDVNGDGKNDLVVDYGVWISMGDGNFQIVPTAGLINACPNGGDFNGDGRGDCLYPSANGTMQFMTFGDGTTNMRTISNFNLVNADQNLYGYDFKKFADSAGVRIVDIDGDRRSDLLNWANDPTANKVYLSNGDGTFRVAPDFNLNTANDQLQKSDGSTSFLLGDFTGHGNVEILRLMGAGYLSAGSDATVNALYVKKDPLPADLLVGIKSSTGLTTTLSYVPLTNSTPLAGSGSADLGARYASDRGTANKASYPDFDFITPMYVVATSTQDSGVGSATLPTEYSYAGLKGTYDGRGWLGFRQTIRQSVAPDQNMSALSVLTQNLQTGFYIGMASTTKTWNGKLNATSSPVLSQTDYVYCDMTSTDDVTLATPLAPCTTAATVQRPYLYSSTETGNDPNGVALPKVVTTNSFNASGDPLTITATTTGTSLKTSQVFKKTTTNSYFADNTAGDNWILGRLQTASVQNTVPSNLLASIITGPGSAPYANAVAGSNVQVSVDRAAQTVSGAVGSTVTAIATATASGGTGPYTYSWARTNGTRSTGSNSNTAAVTVGATLAAGDNFTDTWTVTVTDAQFGTAKAIASVTFSANNPVLQFSNCHGNAQTVVPQPASYQCDLSNAGATAATNIQYVGLPSGVNFSGTPPSTCAANSPCGTVALVTATGATANSYNVNLTANQAGGVSATMSVTLTVSTPPPPPALSFQYCGGADTTAPTAAQYSCQLYNTGGTTTSAIQIGVPSGMSLVGSPPNNVCSANSYCGTVTVATGQAAQTYTGSLTATPTPSGGVANQTVTLHVVSQVTPAAVALGNCTSTNSVTPQPATVSCQVKNTGGTAISSITYPQVPTQMSVQSGPTGSCGPGQVCGNVVLSTPANSPAGTYGGTLQARSDNGSTATATVSVTVASQGTVVIDPCDGSPRTTVPNPASVSCVVHNYGATAISTISYSLSPAPLPANSVTVSGPTGSCLGFSKCGTVTVTTGTSAIVYSGYLVATPNAGAIGTTAKIDLAVANNMTTVTSDVSSISFGILQKNDMASRTATIKNTGSQTASNFSVGAYTSTGPGSFGVSGGTCQGISSLNAGQSCTATVYFAASCNGGVPSTGTLTVSGSNFTAVNVNLDANTSNVGDQCVIVNPPGTN